jgi:hypothetical protein
LARTVHLFGARMSSPVAPIDASNLLLRAFVSRHRGGSCTLSVSSNGRRRRIVADVALSAIKPIGKTLEIVLAKPTSGEVPLLPIRYRVHAPSGFRVEWDRRALIIASSPGTVVELRVFDASP